MAVQGLATNRYVINNDDPYPAAFPRPRTFDDAAKSYLTHGGNLRYLDKVLDYFANRPLASIFPFDVHEMAKSLFPDHRNSTLNRQAVTPARAVINHAHARGWCNLIRIKNFKEDAPKRKKPASPIWLHAFVRQCERDGLMHVAALVLFMAQTAARVSEAVALRWSDVDLQNRSILLLKTKTEANSTRYLTDQLVYRLSLLKAGRAEEDRVFTYSCRYSVNERIEAVCDRAGISYKSSHACGRHTFATSAIDMGMDVPTAMKAGGWKSSKVFLETYVHPRSNAGRMVADRFNQYQYDAEV